jgi:hypothetical protein
VASTARDATGTTESRLRHDKAVIASWEECVPIAAPVTVCRIPVGEPGVAASAPQIQLSRTENVQVTASTLFGTQTREPTQAQLTERIE